jgi:AcrR family transcriptional regulator
VNKKGEIATASLKRGKRAVKAEETRRALFRAAATVVGRRGYEGASVAEITKLAGVANGTFYNYFETRQQLFDQLLPVIGEQLLERIRASLQDDLVGIEREHQRIVTYFEFFQQNPGFLRILNEAEVFAPQAFKQHVKNFATRYSRALKRQLERGELGAYSEDELEAVVYILMGARSYLTMLWRARGSGTRKESGKALIATYLKLVKGGLFATEAQVTSASLAVALSPSKLRKRSNNSHSRAIRRPDSELA